LSRLAIRFFARDAVSVARDLLGCRLVHDSPAGLLVGRIVEVEAYLGDGSDPASHAHRGATPRNRSMFGPPGRFYVYRSMGLHFCANLVCEPEPRASAVLLRAVEPLAGLAQMQAARGGRSGRELASGPGKLCQAFGIAREHDGADALRGALRVESRAGPLEDAVLAGPASASAARRSSPTASSSPAVPTSRARRRTARPARTKPLCSGA